jgi:hypothetical protein
VVLLSSFGALGTLLSGCLIEVLPEVEKGRIRKRRTCQITLAGKCIQSNVKRNIFFASVPKNGICFRVTGELQEKSGS